MRYPTAESDELPWRKEQWSRQTADTPNTPSSSYNAWKHLSACCKEMKCFNPLMWGKGLLSSIVGGFCLHEISTVWVSERAGVAFLILCFFTWADALCIPSGRREGASSYKMTSCEGESGIKLKLATTSGNCSAGVWAGRWKISWKALGDTKAGIPIFAFRNHTGNRFSDLWTAWPLGRVALLSVVAYHCSHILSLQWLCADAPRVGAVAGHWNQAGNISSPCGFRLRQTLQSCTNISPSPQGHQSNSSLCWVLNK